MCRSDCNSIWGIRSILSNINPHLQLCTNACLKPFLYQQMYLSAMQNKSQALKHHCLKRILGETLHRERQHQISRHTQGHKDWCSSSSHSEGCQLNERMVGNIRVSVYACIGGCVCVCRGGQMAFSWSLIPTTPSCSDLYHLTPFILKPVVRQMRKMAQLYTLDGWWELFVHLTLRWKKLFAKELTWGQK